MRRRISFIIYEQKANPADLVSRADPLDTPEKREFWLFGSKWLASVDGPEKHSLIPQNVEFDVSGERKAHKEMVHMSTLRFG